MQNQSVYFIHLQHEIKTNHMKKFKFDIWFRYGKDHDETDFITEEIFSENEKKGIEYLTNSYRSKKIIPFKIELNKK